MCSLISENDKKKAYLERATRAGLKDEQLNAMVNLLWDMKTSQKKVGTLKAKMVSEFKENNHSHLKKIQFIFTIRRLTAVKF